MQEFDDRNGLSLKQCGSPDKYYFYYHYVRLLFVGDGDKQRPRNIIRLCIGLERSMVKLIALMLM
jgi:hypothetical protein